MTPVARTVGGQAGGGQAGGVKSGPTTLLIAALGGEGGGVLMNWIVEAAHLQNFPVQATSVPGVAQRTGATTYYIELVTATNAEPVPVMSLSPTPGEVDIVVATELAEAARVMTNGYVTPERTTLIASTARHYLTLEKMAMGDGRLDPEILRTGLESAAARSIFVDATVLHEAKETQINAILLGALAGSGALGLDRASLTAAIKAGGRAVASNLKGFEIGCKIGAAGGSAKAEKQAPSNSVQAIVDEAVRRLTVYQNVRYAQTYRDRLAPFLDGDAALVETVARHLVLRMAYDDILRVAQVKITHGRLDRIRDEAGAAQGEPVHVTEFFKPGIPEIADLLPPRPARALLTWASKKDRMARYSWPLHIRSTTITGFMKIWLLAKLRWWRPYSYRWRAEQMRIELWLDTVRRMAELGPEPAIEVAELSGIIKGYGSTRARGLGNYERILAELVAPLLAEFTAPEKAAARVRAARQAALADSRGEALSQLLIQSEMRSS